MTSFFSFVTLAKAREARLHPKGMLTKKNTITNKFNVFKDPSNLKRADSIISKKINKFSKITFHNDFRKTSILTELQGYSHH